MTEYNNDNDTKISSMERKFRKLKGNIAEMTPGEDMPHIPYITMDTVVERKMEWLWTNIIPLGIYTLFAGAGGIGKSQLLTFIASKVSTGEAFNAGGTIHQFPQGKVLMMQAEDSDETELKPRLMALGANLENIASIKSVVSKGKKRMAALDKDIYLLRDAALKFTNVKLIIIDPVQYFTGKINDSKSTEVVGFLNALNDLAGELGCAILLNKHLRKRSNSSGALMSATDEVSGSGSWVNSGRMNHMIAVDPDDEDKVLFMQLKLNIAKKSKKAFVFTIVPKTIVSQSQEVIETSIIQFETSLKEISPDQVLNKTVYDNTKQDKITDYIMNELRTSQCGEVLSSQLWKECEDMGVPKSSFYRAKDELIKDNLVVVKGRGRNIYLKLS